MATDVPVVTAPQRRRHWQAMGMGALLQPRFPRRCRERRGVAFCLLRTILDPPLYYGQRHVLSPGRAAHPPGGLHRPGRVPEHPSHAALAPHVTPAAVCVRKLTTFAATAGVDRRRVANLSQTVRRQNCSRSVAHGSDAVAASLTRVRQLRSHDRPARLMLGRRLLLALTRHRTPLWPELNPILKHQLSFQNEETGRPLVR